jgi:hypothetical protein
LAFCDQRQRGTARSRESHADQDTPGQFVPSH